MQGGQVHHARHKFFDGSRANEPHVHLQLITQQVDRVDNAVHTISRVRVQERTANAHGRRTHRKGLQNVRAPTEATIHHHLERRVRERATLAQLTHHLLQHLDTGASKVKLSAAVVRQHNAGQTHLVGLHGIFPRLDTLQQDRKTRLALHPQDIIPVKARVNERRDRTSRSFITLLDMAALHIGSFVHKVHSHILLTTSQLRSIHRDKDSLHVRLLGTAQHVRHHIPVRAHIQLKELRRPTFLVSRVNDLVERDGRQRGNHLDQARLGSSPRQVELTVWVSHATQGRRRDVEWKRRRDAQDLRARIHVANVSQDTWTEPNSSKHGPVLMVCLQIVSCRRVVGPGLRRKHLGSHKLQVPQVQALRHGRKHGKTFFPLAFLLLLRLLVLDRQCAAVKVTFTMFG